MYFKLVNLTYLFAIHKVEHILVIYPEYPYQSAFSIPYWKHRLIAHILSHFPNKYAVIESTKDTYHHSKLSQFTFV